MNYNPYVHRQKIISFDENGQEITNINDIEDISYTIVSKLQDCIYSQDVIEFKKIYNDEYISNDKIIDYFKFDEEEHYWWYNIYSLCTCIYKHEEPTRIHKHLNVRPCNCKNGKRYLTYLCAHNASFRGECYFYDTNDKYIRKCEPNKITNNVLEEIKNYLKENGPIDLTYTSLYYDKNF